MRIKHKKGPCMECMQRVETVLYFQKPLLERVLQQARDTVDKLYDSVTDHFELCLAKCRTSSRVSGVRE